MVASIRKRYIVWALAVLVISYFTLSKVFSLALFGDDFLAIWRFNYLVGPNSQYGYNYLTYLLTPYGAQDSVFGLLYRVFGFNASYYHAVSYLLRLIAAFSLYPLVFYLTKSK